MNILIINTLYTPNAIGGAEVSVQLLAEELVRNGNKVRVVTLHESAKREEKEINGVEVVYLPLKNIYWPFGKTKNKFSKLIWHIIDMYNPFMSRQVGKEIEVFQPQVVHTNNISGFSVSIWKEIKKRNIKLVHTSRDYYLFHPNSTMFNHGENMDVDMLSVLLWSFLKRRMSRHVDTYIGISKYITHFHQDDGFFPNAVKDHIYNSVDMIDVISESSDILKVGFIGRLTEDKGFSIFCDIAGKRKKDPSIAFYAAGRFNNNEIKLKELADNSGITLLGFIPVKTFLEKVDVVVLPVKWREPFGRVVAECAMAGKVVITNFVGGITEISQQIENVYQLEDIDDLILSRKKGLLFDKINNPFENKTISQRYLQYYQ